MDNWVNFYIEFFPDTISATEFVVRCENKASTTTNRTPMLIMHQTQRLVTIADDLHKIRPGKHSLQILFWIICAENVSKLKDNFSGEGKSKYYVKKFFQEQIEISDQNILKQGFLRSSAELGPPQLLTPTEIADLLYSVRCDVVHEGKYWDFPFHKKGRTYEVMSFKNGETLEVKITYDIFRRIMVKGFIKATGILSLIGGVFT